MIRREHGDDNQESAGTGNKNSQTGGTFSLKGGTSGTSTGANRVAASSLDVTAAHHGGLQRGLFLQRQATVHRPDDGHGGRGAAQREPGYRGAQTGELSVGRTAPCRLPGWSGHRDWFRQRGPVAVCGRLPDNLPRQRGPDHMDPERVVRTDPEPRLAFLRGCEKPPPPTPPRSGEGSQRAVCPSPCRGGVFLTPSLARGGPELGHEADDREAGNDVMACRSGRRQCLPGLGPPTVCSASPSSERWAERV